MTVLKYGESAGRKVSERIAAPVASIAALKLIGAGDCADGQRAITTLEQKNFQFLASCALAGDDQFIVAPASGNGRWLLIDDITVLALPITFATADGAILYTVPTGAYLQPLDFFWGITADFTGGGGSSIGVSSSNKAGYTTKGDLLGGATGDVAATLVASAVKAYGTIGAQWGTVALRRKLWIPGDTFRHDRITAGPFTAGAGTVNVRCEIIQNVGA